MREEEMSKFEIGDKVKVLDGSDIEHYIGGFVDGMKEYVGKTFKIKSVDFWDDGRVGYKLKGGDDYTFDGRGLKLIDSGKGASAMPCFVEFDIINNYEIKHIQVNMEKGITTVIFKDNTVKMVKCAEGTEFDVYNAVAAAIAEKVYGSNTAFKKAIDNNMTVLSAKKYRHKKTPIAKSLESLAPAVKDALEELSERVKSLEARNGD